MRPSTYPRTRTLHSFPVLHCMTRIQAPSQGPLFDRHRRIPRPLRRPLPRGSYPGPPPRGRPGIHRARRYRTIPGPSVRSPGPCFVCAMPCHRILQRLHCSVGDLYVQSLTHTGVRSTLSSTFLTHTCTCTKNVIHIYTIGPSPSLTPACTNPWATNPSKCTGIAAPGARRRVRAPVLPPPARATTTVAHGPRHPGGASGRQDARNHGTGRDSEVRVVSATMFCSSSAAFIIFL